MHLDLIGLAGLLSLGLVAGWLGAIIGIGGGVIIVPALVLLFGIDIRIAVAASLVAVVATSTAAGSAYVGEGLANMRLGMTLEIATTLGGVTGGMVAVRIPESVVATVFSVMMLVTAYLLARHGEGPEAESAAVDEAAGHEAAAGPAPEAGPASGPAPATLGFETRGALAGAYYDPYRSGLVRYRASRLPLGSGIAYFAGILSGMLGVGGGFLKVPAMTLGMRVPLKVAAATSNFMIGVTAVSSLFIYFAHGYVHPMVAVPVALGVTGGAVAGAAMSQRFAPRILRWTLVVILLAVAVQMAFEAFGVRLGH